MNTILEILESLHPEYDYTSSDNFIEEGLLDSFDIVTIIEKLERRFDIVVDGEDVQQKYFKNLKTLEQFLQMYVKKNAHNI